MGFDVSGTADLIHDLVGMAAELDAEGNAPAVNNALRSGARIIHAKMMANASGDPKVITGALRGSIKSSTVKRRSGGGKHVTIGVHHSAKSAFYANPVEFGHGGPAPAPAHPFVRPAFDTESDAAYEAMKSILRSALGRSK